MGSRGGLSAGCWGAPRTLLPTRLCRRLRRAPAARWGARFVPLCAAFPVKHFPAGSNYKVNNGLSPAVSVVGSFITNRREMTQKDITYGAAGNYFYYFMVVL